VKDRYAPSVFRRRGVDNVGKIMLQLLSNSVLPVLLIVAGAADVLSLRIPNWLTALTAGLFFPMAYATGMPLPDLEAHIFVGISLFVAGFLFFQLGLFGGGDAKLMAAAGLWFGTAQTLPFLFLTALAGGVLAIFVGAWSLATMHWDIHASDVSLGTMGKRLLALKPNVPYGLAFAVGGIIAFRDTWWMHTTI
jgi:prepilin peptidase CpaA